MYTPALFYQMLLQKYVGKQHIEKLLSEEEKKAGVSNEFCDPRDLLFRSDRYLNMQHTSWYEETIKNIPNCLQQQFLSALENKNQENWLSRFAVLYAYEQAENKEMLLPDVFVHSDNFPHLLTYDSKKMQLLISLLSMYDFVDEIRQIVDRRILQIILQKLTKAQQKFLKFCFRQKNVPSHKPISLVELIQKGKNIVHALEKQGLVKFTEGIIGEPKEFIAHILHQFDIYRAKFIEKTLHDEIEDKVQIVAKQQMKIAMDFMETQLEQE